MAVYFVSAADVRDPDQDWPHGRGWYFYPHDGDGDPIGPFKSQQAAERARLWATGK